MKNIAKLLVLTLLLSSNTLLAQLQGKFNYAKDGHIYFYLTNQTGYQIPVTWGVSNYQKDEHRQFQGVMNPYDTFVYGPNSNWVWEKGEEFIIVYSNGQMAKWTCPETDPAIRTDGNPSFRGKHCNGTVGCNCPGFAPITNGKEWEKVYCKHCGHHKNQHR